MQSSVNQRRKHMKYYIGNFIFPFAMKHRAEARNIVYNYVLQNEKKNWLKRLWEREPEFDRQRYGWYLKDVNYLYLFSPGVRGFIKHRPVSHWEFYKTVFLYWMWIDDDSVHDTTDGGYIKELIVGYRWNGGSYTNERLYRWEMLFADKVEDINFSEVMYGNAFDLGDVRAERPFHHKWAAFLWYTRNSAMNFQYLWLDY